MSSAVINNGHVSAFYLLERFRQRNLYLLTFSSLCWKVKNNPQVSGVKINGSEYLLSQYADDTALLLSDDKYSLEQSLNIFDCFCVCAGLRVNLDKTATIWDDPRLGSDNKNVI